MAKPEVLRRSGLARAKRRIAFQAKESSVFQITKRSRTGRITALGEHTAPHYSLRIGAPSMQVLQGTPPYCLPPSRR